MSHCERDATYRSKTGSKHCSAHQIAFNCDGCNADFTFNHDNDVNNRVRVSCWECDMAYCDDCFVPNGVKGMCIKCYEEEEEHDNCNCDDEGDKCYCGDCGIPDVKPTIAVVQVSIEVVEVLFDFGFPPENIPMEEQQRTENMVLDKIFRVDVCMEVPVDIDTLEELFTKATIKEVAKLTGWRVAELKCRPYYPSRDSFDNTFKKILEDFFEDPDIEEPSTVFLRCFQAYHDERSLTLEYIDAELDELFDRENIPTNFNKAIHNFLLEHTE